MTLASFCLYSNVRSTRVSYKKLDKHILYILDKRTKCEIQWNDKIHQGKSGNSDRTTENLMKIGRIYRISYGEKYDHIYIFFFFHILFCKHQKYINIKLSCERNLQSFYVNILVITLKYSNIDIKTVAKRVNRDIYIEIAVSLYFWIL